VGKLRLKYIVRTFFESGINALIKEVKKVMESDRLAHIYPLDERWMWMLRSSEQLSKRGDISTDENDSS
jgi:hypothetical protein